MTNLYVEESAVQSEWLSSLSSPPYPVPSMVFITLMNLYVEEWPVWSEWLASLSSPRYPGPSFVLVILTL